MGLLKPEFSRLFRRQSPTNIDIDKCADGSTIGVRRQKSCLLNRRNAGLIKSRKADRSSQANRLEAELRSQDPTLLPWVDIMITTYSEDWDILEKTVEGAKNIDYPNKKIWILDDTRRQWLKECCLQEGIGYITRPDNRGKKAGNQNNGLRHTNAPFILQLTLILSRCPEYSSGRLVFFQPKDRDRSDSAVVSEL